MPGQRARQHGYRTVTHVPAALDPGHITGQGQRWRGAGRKKQSAWLQQLRPTLRAPRSGRPSTLRAGWQPWPPDLWQATPVGRQTAEAKRQTLVGWVSTSKRLATRSCSRHHAQPCAPREHWGNSSKAECPGPAGCRRPWAGPCAAAADLLLRTALHRGCA